METHHEIITLNFMRQNYMEPSELGAEVMRSTWGLFSIFTNFVAYAE